MEVRIGIRNIAREVAFESAQSPEELRAQVTSALAGGARSLELVDDKGSTVIVPVEALGFVEIGAQEKGRVGFGSH